MKFAKFLDKTIDVAAAACMVALSIVMNILHAIAIVTVIIVRQTWRQ